MALRISSHLLLGITRINSMKTDYVKRDCDSLVIALNRKLAIRKSLQEEEEATLAEFDDITLPATFQLDNLVLVEDNPQFKGDNHLRIQEHITLPEQIPSEQDGYITISLSEDYHGDSINSEGTDGVRPMDEEFDQSLLGVASLVSAATGAGNIRDFIGLEDELPPMDTMSPEYVRDAVHVDDEIEIPRLLPVEPEETFENRVANEIEIPNSPLPEEVAVSGNLSHPNEGITFFTAEQNPSNSHFSLDTGHESPLGLAMRSTPPAPAEPRGRKRKRTDLYDEVVVLSNDVMKQWLDSTKNIVRKRKCGPCSPLDAQKLKIRVRKENIFRDPSLSGLCSELSDMYKEDYISSRPHLLKTPEPPASTEPSTAQNIPPMSTEPSTAENPPPMSTEPSTAQNPPPMSTEPSTAQNPPPMSTEPSTAQNPPPIKEKTSDTDMVEIEQLQSQESPIRGDYEPIFVGSPDTRNDFTTPASAVELGSNVRTGMPTMPGATTSAETFVADVETPMFSRSPLNTENFALSVNPNEADIEENGELGFLTCEQTTPDTTSQDTHSMLSVTARKVATFMKDKSAATPTSDGTHGDLVLNKLLEGKKRKICARMFYETLVLRNSGFVDLEQEMPYGDIHLRLTPKLLKIQI